MLALPFLFGRLHRVVLHGLLAPDQEAIVVGVEDAGSMFWPAKRRIASSDSQKFSMRNSASPSNSRHKADAPTLPGVARYSANPVRCR